MGGRVQERIREELDRVRTDISLKEFNKWHFISQGTPDEAGEREMYK